LAQVLGLPDARANYNGAGAENSGGRRTGCLLGTTTTPVSLPASALNRELGLPLWLLLRIQAHTWAHDGADPQVSPLLQALGHTPPPPTPAPLPSG
jgi:hypothetical protein